MPKLTLIVVNKRITQRFFMKDERSQKLVNPPTGCIIDQGLVSNSNSTEDVEMKSSEEKTAEVKSNPNEETTLERAAE